MQHKRCAVDSRQKQRRLSPETPVWGLTGRSAADAQFISGSFFHEIGSNVHHRRQTSESCKIIRLECREDLGLRKYDQRQCAPDTVGFQPEVPVRAAGFQPHRAGQQLLKPSRRENIVREREEIKAVKENKNKDDGQINC